MDWMGITFPCKCFLSSSGGTAWLSLSCNASTTFQGRSLRLHEVTGMIQWRLQAFPLARAWIGTRYRDLHCPLATLHSLDPSYFADLHSCLDDGMLFMRVPSGTAIPIGSKLLEARHIPMTQRHDLHKVALSVKRVWLRVADPAAPKRKFSIAVLLS